MNEVAANDDIPNDDDRVLVEVLADEYLERRANGESVTVEDYAAKYPDLAVDIQEVFPALEAIKSLSSEWKRTVVDHHQDGPDLPYQLGEYRLERQIGRGGMGIVYEAEHTSLRRQVAVKLLRMFSLNTEKDIQRFHQEAQAAARLHHTNIVPVFDFGEANGLHYIAMQLIQGQGLDVVVDRLRQQHKGNGKVEHEADANPQLRYDSPSYWHDVAAIGIQAANALNYAHSQGTVHRDIKPANLLLEEGGVLWVADFGLARQDEDGRPTQSGILSGTLRYLAPEHFHGRCDERTDQYGLGLSLYELVTLQPVTGNSSSHAEIMRRITEAKVIQPRQLNENVPRDLETIIVKAIAANPENRFATCKELAEDLARFVEDRPIKARPVTHFEHLRRWAKRNPALAASTALSAALLMLVAVVTSVGFRAERIQRQRAETTTDLTLEALDKVFQKYTLPQQSTQVPGDASLPTPVLTRDSAVMLERLLPIFDQLAEMGDDSAGIRLRAVEARKRVGDIHQRLGKFEQSIEAFRQAIEEYQRLNTVDSMVASLAVANIYNDIGASELMLGRSEDSRISHETALTQLESLGAAPHSELQFQLARTHYLLTRRLRPGESPMSVDDSPPDRPQSHGEPHLEPHRQRRGPEPPHNADAEVRKHLVAAITILESMCSDDEGEPRCRQLLASCLRGMASEQYSLQTREEVDAEERGLSILRTLVSEFGDIAEYQHSLLDGLSAVNTRHHPAIHPNDLPDVEKRLREALDVGRQLVAQHPHVPEYTVSLIHTHNKLGHVLERTAQQAPAGQHDPILEEAATAYRAAATLQAQLARQFPTAPAYGSWLRRFEDAETRVLKTLPRP